MAPGSTFETPRACPFVALELDRDRRSDKPDYRHRCFAEPTPAPRSIAHQEAYCLSPNFSACPVFQDWAVRAAARPVTPGSGTAPPAGAAAGAAAAMDAAAATGTEADHDESIADVESEPVETPPAEQPPLAPPPSADLPEDASVTPAGAEIAAAAAAATGMAAPPTFATTWDADAEEAHQLAAFDAPPHSSYGEPDAGYDEPAATPPLPPQSPAFVPPPQQPTPPSRAADESAAEDAAAAAVPAFLAGRAPRPQTVDVPTQAAGTSLPPPRPAETSRDQLVPSWDIDGRYGAEGPPPAESGGGRLDGILTAIAVIAILALGVAAVLFLPGLLNGKKPAATPPASIVVASFPATAAPTAVATLAPTPAVTTAPSVMPTAPPSVGPVASPRTYKIKAGDSLAKVASKFGVTVQDLLDANPEITNPNNIFVGQIIVIPTPAASP